MEDYGRKYLLLAVIVASLNCYCLAQNCQQNLTHTVVYEGAAASFQRQQNGLPVQWQVMPSDVVFNKLKTITNYNDVVDPQFKNVTYAVNASELTIFNSTVGPQGSMPYATAGLYILNYQNPNCTTAANLIVIRSGPVCSCNASNINNVQLACSVVFAASTTQRNNPILTWRNGSGSQVKQEEPNPASVDSLTKSSSSQLSIASGDTGTYECRLTFNTAPAGPFNYVASGIPNFTASCSVSNCAITTLPATTTQTLPTTAVVLNCSAKNLTHTVVYEGTPARFDRVNNGQLVQWQVMPSDVVFNKLKTITNYNDVVDPQFNNVTYAVNASELTIFNSTVGGQGQGSMPYATAGLYILNYQNPNCTTAANLIVIRSGPVCSCNASNMQLTCSVVFAASTTQRNNPILTWRNSSRSQVKQEEPNPATVDSLTKMSSSQLSIASGDTGTYDCLLTFSTAPAGPFNYVASGIPNFTASCFASCG